MSEWISVKDRMPEERCLAYTPDKDEKMTTRIVPKGILRALSEVTHWMPLPAPPEDKKATP